MKNVTKMFFTEKVNKGEFKIINIFYSRKSKNGKVLMKLIIVNICQKMNLIMKFY